MGRLGRRNGGAFLWLVLGYFQQGEELRSNVEALRLQEAALRLQVRELNESVQQQTEMARASKRQVELTEKAQLLGIRQEVIKYQPIFGGFVPGNIRGDIFSLGIQNNGAACFNATLQLVDPAHGQEVQDAPGSGSQSWLPGAMIYFDFLMGARQQTTRFEIRYQDQLGTWQTQRFLLRFPKWPPPGGAHLPTTRESLTFEHPEH